MREVSYRDKIISYIKIFLYKIYIIGLRQIDKYLYSKQRYTEFSERAIEYGFALECINRVSPQTVLDVGSGLSPWPSLVHECGCVVTAIDEMGDYWRDEFPHNRHFYVIKDDITKSKLVKTFDLVTCISTLEHIQDHRAAVRGMFKLTKPSGWLVLTFPYNESHYEHNAHEFQAEYENLPSICQIFSRKEINSWLSDNGGKLVSQVYLEVFTGDLYGMGVRLDSPHATSVAGRHHLTGILLQKS